ncbi:MAG: hypothetical protein RL326_716 [Pseudomonadota bacterium]
MKRILSGLLSMAISTAALAESSDIASKQLDLGIRLVKSSTANANIVLSPFSVHAGLALTRFGARGVTAAELDRLLFGSELTTADELRYRDLCAEVSTAAGDGVSTTLANAVWVSSQSTIKSEYVSKATLLKSEVRSINFAHSDQARATINSWASEKTASRVPEIIKPGLLSSLTSVVLINALHFKGAWKEPFSKRGTLDEPFHTNGGAATRNVPMMFTSGSLSYHESDGWQAVTLMYASERHTLLLLVPKERLSTSELVGNLSPALFQQAISSSSETTVELNVPRFSIRLSQDLAKSLPGLGIATLFSDKADLSALSETPTIISNVPHEAFVSMDEEGTEAAASTAVIGVLSKAAGEDGPKIVKADHPFAFAIIHRESKAPLFLGVVGDPMS